MNAISVNTLANSRARWLKRAAKAGFWFFFIKGMLWLAAPFVFYFAL